MCPETLALRTALSAGGGTIEIVTVLGITRVQGNKESIPEHPESLEDRRLELNEQTNDVEA